MPLNEAINIFEKIFFILNTKVEVTNKTTWSYYPTYY